MSAVDSNESTTTAPVVLLDHALERTRLAKGTTATTQKGNCKDRSWFAQRSKTTISFVLLVASMALGAAVVAFARVFPLLLAPHAARQTYLLAAWQYDADLSHFDNTAWTYGTDYFLALSMGILAFLITTEHTVSRTHAWYSRGLLFSYMLSVGSGGLAHQLYMSAEDRNTTSFRLLWTLCVGSVTAASGFMGSIASELVRLDRQRGLSILPGIPTLFWAGYAITTTSFVAIGEMSFQRPACDIFIAGITQFPSTFYLMGVLALGLPTEPVSWRARIFGMMSFASLVPLLPLYPLLVQYTNWTLGAVNTFLHTCLWIAWTGQGLILRKVGLTLYCSSHPPPAAVPHKRKMG